MTDPANLQKTTTPVQISSDGVTTADQLDDIYNPAPDGSPDPKE